MIFPEKLRGLLAASTLAIAVGLGQPAAAQNIGIPNGFDLGLYAEAVVQKESSGNYAALNSASHAAGAYQFLPPPLVDIGFIYRSGSGSRWDSYSWSTSARGVSNLNDFLNTSAGHQLQDEAFRLYTLKLWSYLNRNSKATVGQTRNGVRVTEGGLLSAAHFLGAGGLNRFISNGFTGAGLSNLSLILSQNGFSSVAQLDNYVMTRISSGAAAHGDSPTGAVDANGDPEIPSLGLNCQLVAMMDTAGEAVSSPFGVDRTGIASSGYHVGLDMVNNQGKGAPFKAAINGTVVAGPGGNTNAFTMQTSDGRQRFGYLHNSKVDVTTGDTVAPDDVVSYMGDRGSPGAVHLHLMVQLRADVVQQASESIGRVWSAGSYGYGSKGAPLSSSAVSSAGVDTFFVVNPEPFLHHRVPFRPGLLTRQHYIDQGLSRPDGLTLENDCGPSYADIGGAGGLNSSSGGSTVGGGLTNNGIGAANNEQVMTALATEEARDAIIEYGTSSLGALKRQQISMDSNKQRAVGWAAMIISSEQDQ